MKFEKTHKQHPYNLSHGTHGRITSCNVHLTTMHANPKSEKNVDKSGPWRKRCLAKGNCTNPTTADPTESNTESKFGFYVEDNNQCGMLDQKCYICVDWNLGPRCHATVVAFVGLVTQRVSSEERKTIIAQSNRIRQLTSTLASGKAMTQPVRPEMTPIHNPNVPTSRSPARMVVRIARIGGNFWWHPERIPLSRRERNRRVTNRTRSQKRRRDLDIAKSTDVNLDAGVLQEMTGLTRHRRKDLSHNCCLLRCPLTAAHEESNGSDEKIIRFWTSVKRATESG